MNWKNILFHSDLYFAIVAIGTGIAGYLLYSIPFSDLTPLLIISFLALNVCATNRQIDEETDELNVPERTKFLKEHGKTIYFFSVFGLILSLILSLLKTPNATLICTLTFIFGHFYSHTFPRVGRLREFFVIKNMSVGVMWALMAILTPVYFGIFDLSVIALFLLFFFRMTFQTGLIDLRDIEGDKKAGIKTIPMILGQEKTLLVAQIINLIPIGLFFITKGLFLISTDFLLLNVFMAFNAFLYILALQLDIHTEWIYAAVIDSETLLPSLALLILKISGTI